MNRLFGSFSAFNRYWQIDGEVKKELVKFLD